MRLNRYLAQCGAASRRAAEDLIRAGRVAVNGRIVRGLAVQVNPDADHVQLDGKAVSPPARFQYWALNKPPDCDVTRGDPHAERTVFDLLPVDLPESVQPVGRLDRPTTGLLILTNDGELNFRLTHPSRGVEKEYLAFGVEAARPERIELLMRGVELEDGLARAIRAEAVRVEADEARGAGRESGPAIRLIMHEGRKRIVRRLCEVIGYRLTALHRVRIGPLRLRDLPPGASRSLAPEEIEALRRAVGLPVKANSDR